MVSVAGEAPDRPLGPLVRREVRVEGIVQGVGFRPHVYNLAAAHRLTGWVLNNEQGVLLEVEGSATAVEDFCADLQGNPPPLAVITRLEIRDLEPMGYQDFRIVASQNGAERKATVPADAALCPDCRRELADPANRRHRYPFTNCTNCGPRFTIVRDIPYDRPQTTMAGFALCPACLQEYHDPKDRRFHAQPNACPDCGPAVSLLDTVGRPVVSGGGWAEAAAGLLREGRILAVKGLGGFHLACDAANPAAVARLRERKRRPNRPFAVMARDLATVRRLCRVSAEEERLLTSPSAPIVLLERLPDSPVAAGVAPGLANIGVMLAYTPLHVLLLEEGPPALVMTSGNPTGLPLCIENAEAVARLGHIADAFVTHDRAIYIPCDDSVMQVADGQPQFLRRSRGFVPRPLRVSGSAAPAVLGVGGDLKNTFCLLSGERAVFSQHLGDLEAEEAKANWRKALAHLQRLAGITPGLVACDMHPAYHSATLAREVQAERLIQVQHHHAHMAACMAEHGLEGEAIGLVLDGTGYGTDGSIWGFEVLAGGYGGFERIAHLKYSPLPGGEAAIRHPLMAAAGMVTAHLGDQGLERLLRLAPGSREVANAAGLMRAGIHCPPAGSAGRLFDAVSALTGICRRQTYEGQAAIELGALAVQTDETYPFGLSGDQFDAALLLDALLTDRERGTDAAVAAGRFLSTVAAMCIAGARRAREVTGLSDVCLGGGTFHSARLLGLVTVGLRADGFRVFRPNQLPPGDGGLALGQAMIARRRWQEPCV
ncbi:MAG TPA: carbamoyltransferase HypF [Symbiobacteriaceae bacterium]|nr:carbamoyltransferase HypF [Symbiobacteriaceae bacterium]